MKPPMIKTNWLLQLFKQLKILHFGSWPENVEVKEIRDFDGEEVEMKKLIDANSDKGKASIGPTSVVDVVLEQIRKKPKLSVLDMMKKTGESTRMKTKKGGDENHVAFHGDSPSEGNELILHSSFGMPSLLCRPMKEERMALDYQCDREFVQESYNQDDENVINFGVQTKGDDDLMEISAQEYQKSLTLFENLGVLCDRFEVKKVPSYAGMLQVSLPLFYGCHRDYDTWEKSIENLFVLLNIEKESEKIALAIGCFCSSALNWWKLVSNIYSHHWYYNLDDWHDLRNALRERYAGTNTFDEAKVKFLNCKQNGRSVQSYFEELEDLFLSSGVDENDYMLTDHFHYGLDKGFKQHPKIRRQSRLYEAYYAALDVEREHDTSCGWNGPIKDQGLVFGAEDGDQRTCIFRTKCSVGWSNEVDLVIDGGSSTDCLEVDDSRTNPLKEGGDDENHVTFHGDSPSEGNELVLHSSFGMPSLLCRPIKEERMDLDYLCDRELVQESYDQDDENFINFGVQTKGDDSLMEISAQGYQRSLTLGAP
ncbi:OLC1v1013256C1 [Oldenlandia corymbosa var. corymbosa]|uniref:OLC1v1013256C1 n=1 Tax=Oldenlandia corymbosa var. corymbosa TaxID=529605 RepID=A0AAV1E131_OLDCO|nr:OLC1v1013256C1 [Oldenlandia corymbosa var. corymbosa]